MRPAAEESDLKRLVGNPELLRPDFRTQMEDVKQLTLGRVAPKTLFGKAVRGALQKFSLVGIHYKTEYTIVSGASNVPELKLGAGIFVPETEVPTSLVNPV